MLSNTDRTDSWASSPVRDAKGFVKIEMANIGPDVAGTAKADLGIHIGPVHIDLATRFMDERADFSDGRFKDSMSRGIGDHEGGKAVAVQRDLGLEVAEIDIPFSVTGDTDDLHSCHNRTGRIGPVGGNRYQAYGAVGIAA